MPNAQPLDKLREEEPKWDDTAGMSVKLAFELSHRFPTSDWWARNAQCSPVWSITSLFEVGWRLSS